MSQRCFLCLAPVCKHRLESLSWLSTVLAGAISLLSFEVVGGHPTTDRIRYSAHTRCPLTPSLWFLTHDSTPRPEPGVGGGGPRVCGEPWASQSQWSELASEDAAFLLSLVVGFAIGACTRVASRSISAT